MEDLILKVQKRAFPSKGRARVPAITLEILGIGEQGEVDIGIPDKKRWVTVAVYGDSLIPKDTIRLSSEDIAAIGVKEGDEVSVRKTPPFAEQVKQKAKDTADQVSVGFDDMKGKISAKVSPVAKQAGDAAKGAYARVSQELPTREEISNAIDGAKKQLVPALTPDDAGALLSLIYTNRNAVRSVIIPATKAPKTIAALALPPGVVAVAIRREKNTLIVPDTETEVVPGDRLFLVGNETTLPAVLKEIGE